MKTVVLSGGNFGGETVTIDDGTTEITKTDNDGNVWVYDTSLSKTSHDATFKEFIPADEVNNGSN